MKIIFFDVDGVLTTYNNDWKVDEQCVQLLHDLCDQYNIKLVMSSSWRRENVPKTIKLMSRSGMTSLTRYLYGVTSWLWDTTRGKEIDRYLKIHPEVESYVIIDDEDFGIHQKDRLVKTDYKTGLTQDDVNKIKELIIKD